MSIRYPTGYPVNGRIKIAVAFPDKLFLDIIAMAKHEKKTFNDMVVELVQVGKFDLEESDKHEPKVTEEMKAGFGWKGNQ